MSGKIGVSYGSAVELGLIRGRLATRPRTAYLLLGDGACRGSCAFCPQSSGSGRMRIARVSWPRFPRASVLAAACASGSIERVCFQCQDDPGAMEELPYLVGRVSGWKPVSVSMPPRGAELMRELKVAGAERLTIPLDCASQRLFREVKGRAMSDCLDALRDAVGIFGRGMVGTHLIVGLGESEEEVVAISKRLVSMGVRPSLFALTPVRGTRAEAKQPPPLATYRRLQLALHMIEELGAEGCSFSFDGSGRLTGYPVAREACEEMVRGGTPFQTRGCPGCNRPYFNERVSGPIFNFPHPVPREEIKRIEEELFGSA